LNYLVDTNIISEVRKGAQCDSNVAAWYASIGDKDIYLSVLVLGEIRKGIERARPGNPAQARALESWLMAVARSFGERILPIDHAVADEWGRMGAKRSVSTIDALLAATAKVHRMTLATRNVSDVADLGAKFINPFAYPKT
jgi:toxin FitB